MAINITSFAYLLKKVDFDAIIDHLALTHIIKSKAELANTRIKKLLEVLSSYLFNLYHIKGKDMDLSDFLSRQKNDDSNPHEIIPISFNMQNMLYDRYYNIGEREEEGKYLIQTRLQSKSSSITLPAGHGVNKGINSSVRPEIQVTKNKIVATKIKAPTQTKLRIGQSSMGLKRKVEISTPPQLNKPAHN